VEEEESPFLFLAIDNDLLLDDKVYFGVPEPLVDNTVAFLVEQVTSKIAIQFMGQTYRKNGGWLLHLCQTNLQVHQKEGPYL
jgi:hypothetical protein